VQLFFDPDIRPGLFELREVEARHATQVLRKRVGDELDLVNGRGSWFKAQIVDLGKKRCTLEVESPYRQAPRANHRLSLYVAPTKNIDRFEWILEKATEIGVDDIFPILTENSERSRLRPDRLERVLESAMKQSLRAWIPVLHPLAPLAEAMVPAADNEKGYFAYLGDREVPLLRDTYPGGQDVRIVIGPEGGFSPTEAQMASSRGYQWVSLGPNRLRTETAAITAVLSIEQMNW
jgi:16S rRNA (uracil1498-N3)-methyltransferase